MFGKIIVDVDQIKIRVSEMALEIDSYYKDQNIKEPILVVGVLTNAIFFMADLLRRLSTPTEMDFIRVSTYPDGATTAQEPRIITPIVRRLLHDIPILIVDDILDTGKTLSAVKQSIAWPHTTNVKTAVLFRKPKQAVDGIKADFVGFDVPDEFLIGCGLDHMGRFRDSPMVAPLE